MLPRYLIYTDRTDIQSFIDESSLNKELYEWMCSLREGARGRAALKRDPLDLFNQAYYICTLSLSLPDPLILYTGWRYTNYFSYLFMNYEIRIYDSIAYALLALQANPTDAMKELAARLKDKYKGEHHYFPVVNEIVTRRLDRQQLVVTDFSRKPFDCSQLHTINWSSCTNDYHEDSIRFCVYECQTFDEKKAVIEAIRRRFMVEYPNPAYDEFRQKDARKYLDSAIDLMLLENGENIAINSQNIPNNTQEYPVDSQESSRPLKVRIRVLMEMLKLLDAGQNVNDLTKIARLLSFLTGSSYKKTYRLIQEGFSLTDYHADDIKEVNEALADLGIKIKIDKS